MNENNRTKSAFTLIELLVVITIIGILSGLIVIGMNSLTQDARDAKRKNEIDTVRKALYSQSNMGSKGYPVETNWCAIGKTGDCPNLTSALVPDFLPKLPQDPLYNSSNKEYSYMYKSDGTTFDLYTKLEDGGVISLSPGSVQISKDKDCSGLPGEWINTGLGFCVMKWEARFDGTTNCTASGCPISTGASIPIVSSSPYNIFSAGCKAIGAHLMNNAEWMALARDIESVGSNWTGGSVGSGVLKRGNSGDTSPGGYNGGVRESGLSSSLAVLTLNNGATINHFSGNVSEWVDYTVSGVSSRPQNPSNPYGGSQIEFKNIVDWGSYLTYNDVGPKNTSFDSTYGVGRIYYVSSDDNSQTMERGGDYYGWPVTAGVFSVHLYNNPGQGSGFRCVW